MPYVQRTNVYFVVRWHLTGGFDLGLERAGMQCVAQVEIDDYATRVLIKHWPDVPKFRDVREVGLHNLPECDVITFGSPCQDLSVAGRRRGFAGERSGLYFEAIRVIRELRPAFALWENVPGALSSNSGRDFGSAIDALADAGALDISWRVLDAQWFGVAQRRRRVFVVADFRAERAAEILFERNGRGGHTPPRREAGTGITATVIKGAAIGRKPEAGPQYGEWLEDGTCYTLNCTEVHAVAVPRVARQAKGAFTDPANDNVIVAALSASLSHGVRRLTPTECERLQGFPDGWTAGQSDSVRYRQLGNAVCVPVAEWIARRMTEAAI